MADNPPGQDRARSPLPNPRHAESQAERRERARGVCLGQAPDLAATLAHSSRSWTARLKTSLPLVESGSTQK